MCFRVEDKGIRKLQRKSVLQKWPNWNIRIEKISGWNHMNCTNWGKNFDWNPRNRETRIEEIELKDPLNRWLQKICWKLGVLIWLVFLILLLWPSLCYLDDFKIKQSWKETNMTWSKFILIAIIFFPISILCILFSIGVFFCFLWAYG